MNLLDKMKLAVATRGGAQQAQVTKLTQKEAPLIDRLARKAALQHSPAKLGEVDRICALPICFPLTTEELEAMNTFHIKADAPENPDGSPFTLKATQAEAFYSYETYGKVFGPIEVGGGKTLIALRICAMAHERGRVKKSMIVVPPGVMGQLIDRDIPWARRRVPLGQSFVVMHRKPADERMAIAMHTSRGCFLVPYSMLSHADGSMLLEYINPELIVFDEAHNLANLRSARTRVIDKFVEKKGNSLTVVALSGTCTKKSLKEYAHILRWTHAEKSPVPLDDDVVNEWGALIDADGNFWDKTTDQRVGTAPMRPLVHWSNEHFKHEHLKFDVEGMRRALQNRLLTAPGIVPAPADALGATLIITNEPCKLEGKGADKLKELDDRIETMWVAPDGTEIDWAMHKFNHRYILSSGLYYDHQWPQPEHYAELRRVSYDEACNHISQAMDHHEAAQEYHKCVREWLKYNELPGLDRPMLIGRSCSLHGEQFVGKALYQAWKRAKDLEFDGMPERTQVPIRVCDYKVQAAIRWTKKQKRGGIVWYLNDGLGEWVAELAERAGLPVVHCPAGERFNKILRDPEAPKLFERAFAICSIKAHSVGKNLQYFDRQFFLQFPRPESDAQQVLGRLHREGQAADEVQTFTCISTDIDEISLAATLNDSVYVFETWASARKVLIANWNPMPSIYGAELLKRAGADAKQLNIRQRQLLEEQFGQTKNNLRAG